MEEDPSIDNLRALEADELRLRLGALETELGLWDGSSNTNDENDDEWSVPAPPSFCARFSHCIRRSITVPCVFLVSVLVAVCVIIFCIFPASLLLVIVVAFYYCCARDPIPFRVLLTAMFGTDGEAGGSNSPPARTVPEIHEAVIKRRCHGPHIQKTEDDQLVWDMDDGTHLLFSKPLAVDEIEERYDAAPWLMGEPKLDKDRLASVEEQDVEMGVSTDEAEDHENDAKAGTDREEDVETGEVIVESQGETGDDSSSGQERAEDPPGGAPGATDDAEIEDRPDPSPAETTPQEEAVVQDDSESHACDICLLPFEKDQIVAWSHNSQCEHAYHLDCITDWLIKQKSCPNCRADYLRKK